MSIREPLDRQDLGASLAGLAPAVVRGGLVAGIVGLATAAGLAWAGPGIGRFMQSWLVAFAFLLTITLGALFFVILQHLVRAGWSVVVRRLGEAMAMNLPLLAVLFLPLALTLPRVYEWAQPAAVAHDALLRGKSGYLNPAFFVGRWVVFFALWSFLAHYFWSRSVKQDATGEVKLTMAMERFAAPAVILFAVSLNFSSFDLLMSIDPHWYSTIFGVYIFSGGTVGFLALLSVVTALLQRTGRLRGVTDDHWHDLGKLVFAFTVFWAYIGFSQYMLTWYANLPEETTWYAARQSGGWTTVTLLLLFGHFLVPFFLLLPRFVKRSPRLFGPVAAWMLVMHYADIYWLVMPRFSPGRVPLHPLDLVCVLGLGGLWLAAVAWRMRRVSLVPERDPRLEESLAFENA
jgi:hypothetical protein